MMNEPRIAGVAVNGVETKFGIFLSPFKTISIKEAKFIIKKAFADVREHLETNAVDGNSNIENAIRCAQNNSGLSEADFDELTANFISKDFANLHPECDIEGEVSVKTAGNCLNILEAHIMEQLN